MPTGSLERAAVAELLIDKKADVSDSRQREGSSLPGSFHG